MAERDGPCAKLFCIFQSHLFLLYFSISNLLAKGSRGREGWVLWRPLWRLTEGLPCQDWGNAFGSWPSLYFLYFTRICNCICFLGPSATSVLLYNLFLLAEAFECYLSLTLMLVVGLLSLSTNPDISYTNTNTQLHWCSQQGIHGHLGNYHRYQNQSHNQHYVGGQIHWWSNLQTMIYLQL